MRVIGFNFTKISAEKLEGKTASISTDIKFDDISKDEIEMLKEEDVLKVLFSFDINYSKDKEQKKKDKEEDLSGKVEFKGTIVLSVSKDESKDILKSWKKKELPVPFKIALMNLILKKCTVKALDLEDSISLAPHLPLPNIAPKKE
jgi:hypothetical protein